MFNPLVVVLAYDGLCTFEFGIAVEVFGLPRPEMGENWYQFAVAGLENGAMRATGGIHVVADGGLDLLENTRLSIDKIAETVGFGTAASMRHHFRQQLHLTPSTYRLRFGHKTHDISEDLAANGGRVA